MPSLHRHMSSQTAKRTLVYFLVELGVVSDFTAAVYFVKSGLKQATVEDLIQEMKEWRDPEML